MACFDREKRGLGEVVNQRETFSLGLQIKTAWLWVLVLSCSLSRQQKPPLEEITSTFPFPHGKSKTSHSIRSWKRNPVLVNTVLHICCKSKCTTLSLHGRLPLNHSWFSTPVFLMSRKATPPLDLPPGAGQKLMAFISCYTGAPWPPLWRLLLTLDCNLLVDSLLSAVK